MTRLINFCWSLFQWTLVLVVAGALVVGCYLYFRMDHEISRHFENILASHYRQLGIRVGGARFEQGRGIAIYDVSLLEPRSGNSPQPLLSIDELFAACDARLENLLANDLPVKRIVIRRARLHAIRGLDGRWNVATLLPLPKFSDQTPQLVLEDGTLVLQDTCQRQARPLVIHGVDMTLTPVGEDAPVRPAAMQQGTTQHRAAPKSFRIDGSASGLPAQEFRFAGEVNVEAGSVSLDIDVRGLEVSPELFAALPCTMPALCEQAQLYGRADVSVHAERAGGTQARLNWSADLALSRGRLDHGRLPQSLTELSIKAQADQKGLVVRELRGKCGTADVALACKRNGWTADAPLSLAARLADLSLDSRLQASSPDGLARFWSRFQPSGKADADVQLTYDGRRWQPKLTVRCRDVSFTDAAKFPYRLERATGTVRLYPSGLAEWNELEMDLTAQGGGRPIHVTAHCFNLPTSPAEQPPDHFVGWVDVSGQKVPIHERLLAALPEKGARLARSLRPEGTLDFHWRLEWAEPQPHPEKSLELKLQNCSVCYDAFPYPLEGIQGRVTALNRHWILHDLFSSSRQGKTIVTCRGESLPEGDGSRLQLVLQGMNLPLDEHLRQALSPEAQKAWTELQPQGQIDFVANVSHLTGQPKPKVEVALQPHERSVSIKPKSFPYRLEQFDGRAVVTTGHVDLKNVQARHGHVTVTTQGSWQAADDGGWELLLTGLNADRLTAPGDLLEALPPGLQKVVDRLRPVGRFGLFDSTLSFVKRPDAPRLLSAWDAKLDCHQVALQSGFPLENITGGVRLIGRSDGAGAFTAGELAIDSLTAKDFQLTNVRGPVWADNTVCLLGRPATEKQAQPPRPLTAQTYGGVLTCDGRLQCDGPARYQLFLALGGADVARLARERLGSPSDLSGTVSGRLELSGTGHSTHALDGAGELHIVDANIYRLPVLVALLKVLQIRTPDTTAFHSCDMQFEVQGEHIHFRQLNLLGDAVSLYGRGETNFDRQLNLVFYSLVGPVKLPLPLLNSLAGQASQQILQLKVSGTMDNPKIERDAFPAVNQVLQQIQAELQDGAATVTTPPTAARNLFTPQRR